jgi:hypothetical protein
MIQAESARRGQWPFLEEKCTQKVERRHRKGEQGWWKIKVVVVIPEMTHKTSGGLAEMEQIHPGKNKEFHYRLKDAAAPTNMSAREMDVASVLKLFPMLNLKCPSGRSQTVDD